MPNNSAVPVDTSDPPSILGKAFAILNAFTHRRRVMTLSEISRISGLPKSTTYRVIARLLELNALERHGEGYRVGMGLLALSSTSPASAFRDVAQPFLEALHRRTGHTVHLAVLRGADVVYLEKLVAPGARRIPTVVGGRLPAHCTAGGKMLLAGLDSAQVELLLPEQLMRRTPKSVGSRGALLVELGRVRAAGTALERGETAAGLACVAVPVCSGPQTVAALSVSFPDGQDRPSVPLLTAAAARISAAIRAAPRTDWIPPIR